MVQSILSQSFQDFKIVLVDDLSTDGTWQLLQNLQQEHPDKIISVQIVHKGYGGGARNFGMTVDVESEFVWFVDCDDYLQSNALQTIYEKIQRFPEKDVYYFCLSQLPVYKDFRHEPWNKIVQTEYAKKFKFEEVPFANDVFWSFCVMNSTPDEKIQFFTQDNGWFDSYVLHYTGQHTKYPKNNKDRYSHMCKMLESLCLEKQYLKDHLKKLQQARDRKRSKNMKVIYKRNKHHRIKIVVYRR